MSDTLTNGTKNGTSLGSKFENELDTLKRQIEQLSLALATKETLTDSTLTDHEKVPQLDDMLRAERNHSRQLVNYLKILLTHIILLVGHFNRIGQETSSSCQ